MKEERVNKHIHFRRNRFSFKIAIALPDNRAASTICKMDKPIVLHH
jgi:hypothetical protein